MNDATLTKTEQSAAGLAKAAATFRGLREAARQRRLPDPAVTAAATAELARFAVMAIQAAERLLSEAVGLD